MYLNSRSPIKKVFGYPKAHSDSGRSFRRYSSYEWSHVSMDSGHVEGRHSLNLLKNGPLDQTTVFSGFGDGYKGGYGGGSDGFDLWSASDQNSFFLSEKATMQNLNDRLASYLEKVHSLAGTNNKLELQIREYYEKKGPAAERDYSHYWAIINGLKDKINGVTVNNANILVRIDNAKMAADDFKTKSKLEQTMRQAVEADMAMLRRMFDQHTLTKADLEMQIEYLQNDLVLRKKEHAEELAAMQSKVTGTINVEVDAAPQQDLNRVLDEIRAQYEGITDKHRRDQEAWFNEKSSVLSKEVAVSTEIIQTTKTEINNLRRTMQGLEIELQSQLSMKAALKNTLRDTEARYSAMLTGYQNHINMLEQELGNVRSSIEQQGQEYRMLLDIKTKLEQELDTMRSSIDQMNQDYSRLEPEIATYRSLLETEESRPVASVATKTTVTHTKVHSSS